MRAAIPGWTWVTSLAVHGVIAAGVGWLAFHSLTPRAAKALDPIAQPERMIAVELPAFATGTLVAPLPDPDATGEPPTPSGGATIPRIDTQRDGRGGDPIVAKPAVNLSDVDEGMRLSPGLLSRLDRDQVQRIESAKNRASREDRRSTTHPMELTFLASGKEERAERRAPSGSDPSRGALFARSAAVFGGVLGSPDPIGEDGSRSGIGGQELGTTERSPGLGVHDGRAGGDHRRSAAVMMARPDITLGPVAVEALVKARPNDSVDSDQEVATTVRALVHASTAGGLAGDGIGGSAGGGDPGAGGSAGDGSRARPLGKGDGDWLDFDTNDARLVPYFRRVHARVDPLWANAFPRSAMVDLKQGTVILEFTIAPDGTARVMWPPVRPSGIDEFDRNCANAIRRASPFDPVPKELGQTTLHIRAPFVAVNPIVK